MYPLCKHTCIPILYSVQTVSYSPVYINPHILFFILQMFSTVHKLILVPIQNRLYRTDNLNEANLTLTHQIVVLQDR